MSNIDWSIKQNLDDFSFQSKSVVIRWIPRLKIWFSGRFSRGSFEKDFKIKNGIKKHSKPSSAILPKYYAVNTKCNDYIAVVRDSIVMNKYESYKETQRKLKNTIDEIQSDLLVAVKNLETKKEILEDQKSKLTSAKRTKNDMNIIAYQAAIEAQKTSIKSSEFHIGIMRENLSDLEAQETKNKQQWRKQVDHIESAIARLTNSFEHNITKKVKNTFDFGHFETQIKEYSESIKDILNGEKY